MGLRVRPRSRTIWRKIVNNLSRLKFSNHFLEVMKILYPRTSPKIGLSEQMPLSPSYVLSIQP